METSQILMSCTDDEAPYAWCATCDEELPSSPIVVIGKFSGHSLQHFIDVSREHRCKTTAG